MLHLSKTWYPARLSVSSIEPLFAARMTAKERQKRRHNLALLCTASNPPVPLSNEASPCAVPPDRRRSSLAVEARRWSLSPLLNEASDSQVANKPPSRPPLLGRIRCALSALMHRFRSGHRPLPPHEVSDVSVQAEELSVKESPRARPPSDKEQILVRIRHVGVPVLPPSWEYSAEKSASDPPPDVVDPSLLMERQRAITGYDKRRVSFSEPLETVYHVDCPKMYERCQPGETCVPKVENRPLIVFL